MSLPTIVANASNASSNIVITDPVTAILSFIFNLGLVGVTFVVFSFFIGRALLGHEESHSRTCLIIYVLIGATFASFFAGSRINFTGEQAIGVIIGGFFFALAIYFIKREMH